MASLNSPVVRPLLATSSSVYRTPWTWAMHRRWMWTAPAYAIPWSCPHTSPRRIANCSAICPAWWDSRCWYWPILLMSYCYRQRTHPTNDYTILNRTNNFLTWTYALSMGCHRDGHCAPIRTISNLTLALTECHARADPSAVSPNHRWTLWSTQMWMECYQRIRLMVVANRASDASNCLSASERSEWWKLVMFEDCLSKINLKSFHLFFHGQII